MKITKKENKFLVQVLKTLMYFDTWLTYDDIRNQIRRYYKGEFPAPDKFRKLIQKLRFNYETFFGYKPHDFLIASNEGYKITSDPKLIEEYLKTNTIRTERSIQIIHNMKTVLRRINGNKRKRTDISYS